MSLCLAACQPVQSTDTLSASPPAVNLVQPDARGFMPLESQVELMALYYNISALPLPTERMAEALSNDYRETRNSFQRQELLNALEPRITQLMRTWQNQRCIQMKSRVQLGHFDLKNNLFPIYGLEASSMLALDNSNYALMLNSTRNIHQYQPETQQQAREIEEVISKNGAAYSYPVRLYLCAQGVRDSEGKYIITASMHKIEIDELKEQPLIINN